MAMEEDEIIARVKEAYPDATVDAAGEDCNFELFVITKAFEGKSLLQRQKAVLGLFKEELGSGKLHALSVTAKTPEDPISAPHLVQVTIN